MAVTAAILIPTLITSSLNEVNHGEYGIAYNTYTKVVDYDKLYDEGRYYLSIPSKFFRFQRTVQSLYLTKDSAVGDNRILCFSSEGLGMILGITVQYQINRDQMFEIFREFGGEETYLDYLENLVRETIMNNCPKFNGSDYYHIRGVVEQHLENCTKEMVIAKNAKSTIILIQLSSVNHPLSYDSVNEAKQKLLQTQLTLLTQREENINDALTSLYTTQASVNISLIDANSQKQSLISKAQELSEVEDNKWKKKISNFNGYTNEEIIEQLQYMVKSTKPNIIWQG